MTAQAGNEVITITPETAPEKLKVPVDSPPATGEVREVVPTQGVPGKTAQAFALGLLLIVLLLDVAGMMLAKPGMCERNAKTSALEPMATTTTPIVTISITFVIPPVDPFETVLAPSVF
jgi:hypothetical protein